MSWLRSFGKVFADPAPDPVERVCLVDDMPPKYALADPGVLPAPRLLSEEEYRHLVATGMLKPVHEHGPTRVGLTIGCNEQTIRHARDKRSTLRGDLSWNMLLVDEHALDAVAAHFNKALVDKDPRPVDWNEVTLTAAELLAEVSRARVKGHVSHLDLPRLRTLVQRAMAAMQGAA